MSETNRIGKLPSSLYGHCVYQEGRNYEFGCGDVIISKQHVKNFLTVLNTTDKKLLNSFLHVMEKICSDGGELSTRNIGQLNKLFNFSGIPQSKTKKNVNTKKTKKATKVAG